MSRGHDLLRAAIRENSHSSIRLLKPELFTEDELYAYSIFDEYYCETGDLPPLEHLLRKTGLPPEVGIPGEETSFTYNYLRVIERQKKQSFLNLLESGKNCTGEQKQKELVEQYIAEINKFEVHQKSFDAQEFIELSWNKYLRNKELKDKGLLLGVSSGWSEFDEIIHYLQPGNLYVFSGRRNLGKSYIMARMVLKALIARKRVLLVSMEMTAEEFADRIIAIQLGLNPDDIMEARLSLEDYQRFEVTKDNFEQYHLRIIEGNLNKRVSELIAEIKEYNPDIVFIDGSYMLTPDDKYLRSDWEKQGHIHETLKTNLALGCNLPVVCTLQEKRGKKGIDEGTVSRSDIIEQIASVLVSIQLIKGNEHRRLLNIIKNRHGRHDCLVINFLFSRMDMEVDLEETRKKREEFMNGAARQAQQQAMNGIANNML